MNDFEQALMGALGGGHHTYRVAIRMNCSTAFVRRELIKLERKGYVQRDKYHSSSNSIYWVPKQGDV